MKQEMKKGQMEVALKAPETANLFQKMRRFTNDMERFFEDFQGFGFPNFFENDFAPFRMGTTEWVPQIEVFQNDRQFIVQADLPGLTKDNVKVEITDQFLTISGERKEEKEEKREGFYRSERDYGSFYRQIPLPEGAKIDNALATFVNGVLKITIAAPQIATQTRELEITEPTKEKFAKAAA